MGMSLATKRRGGELLSLYHRVVVRRVTITATGISTVKKRFEVWVLLLYNFLSATYNLISGTNPHERRLPFNG